MPRQARLNLIKRLRCYTVAEAADVTGVSPRTVREWVKTGLRILDVERPALMRGDDMLAFLKSRRESKKVKLGETEFFCMGCGKARGAAGGVADCNISANRAVLTALCETCETVLTKPVALGRVPHLETLFELTIQRHD